MIVNPTARLSTRILRVLADKGPMTVAEIMIALELANADGDPVPLDKDVVALKLRNFRHRGRVISHDRQRGVPGNPARWSITPEAVVALNTVRTRKARRYGPARSWDQRKPKPRDLSPRVSTYCRWFLKAGWGPRETAKLFDLKPRDLIPLQKAAA